MSNGLPMARLAVQLTASLSVTKVISDVVKNNTNVDSTLDGIKVAIGSLVIGSMIVEQASNHVDRQWNAFYAWNEKRKEEQAKRDQKSRPEHGPSEPTEPPEPPTP